MLTHATYNALNPFPWYAEMRATAPVAFSAERRSWSVFRYADVQRVLSEYATFSSEFGRKTENTDQPISASIISTDPPRHRQLRNLVTQAFTPRAVARLEPRIVEIVEHLLDAVAPTGRMDVVEDFAVPLPVTVIAELLGIPPEDRTRFKVWSDAVVTGSRSMEMEALSKNGRTPQQEMSAYFRHMLDLRRREPGEDLISGLLAAQIDGEHLTELQLLGFCVLLLIAGNETTTNLIGNAVLCFDEHRDALAELREEPALLPGAIEEVLRYRSPVQSMFRVTVREAEIGDQRIPFGAPVVAWIGSANHDEAQFERPEVFDIHRSPNRHLAFGHGIHFCLGAPLARLEARIALEALLRRLPNLRRVGDVPLETLPGTIVYGLKHLPVTFTPSSL